MSSPYAYPEQPSAPPMYPAGADHIRPVPPVRSEFNRHAQEEALLAPKVPPRMDIPADHDRPISRRPLANAADEGLRRADEEGTTGEPNTDSACNYNRYATIKTIGHVVLLVALLTSNAVHLRLLVLQKHHDGIWIASLILVCISILLQVGLGFLLYLLVRGDVRNPQQQTALERFNIIVLVLVIAITVINVVINMFMLTINPRSFLDGPTLELLQRGRI